jgi:hypothetical protein
VVDWLPHVWCAGYIDTAWYLFDPTWGAGYVSNRKFFRQINNYYFMTKPGDLITSHMPFDPLWQFLHYPVTNQEFYDRKFRENRNKTYFNFADTLKKFEGATNLERYISSARRIEQNGIINSFIITKLRILRGEIEYYRKKAMTEKYNIAIGYYNDGINMLNRFIQHNNSQFYPEKDPLELGQMLDSTEFFLTATEKILAEIQNPEVSITASMALLNESLDNTWQVLNMQKLTFHTYLKTRK